MYIYFYDKKIQIIIYLLFRNNMTRKLTNTIALQILKNKQYEVSGIFMLMYLFEIHDKMFFISYVELK